MCEILTWTDVVYETLGGIIRVVVLSAAFVAAVEFTWYPSDEGSDVPRQAYRCKTSYLGQESDVARSSAVEAERVVVTCSRALSRLRVWGCGRRKTSHDLFPWVTREQMRRHLWKTWICIPPFGCKYFDHFRIKRDRTTKAVAENFYAAMRCCTRPPSCLWERWGRLAQRRSSSGIRPTAETPEVLQKDWWPRTRHVHWSRGVPVGGKPCKRNSTHSGRATGSPVTGGPGTLRPPRTRGVPTLQCRDGRFYRVRFADSAK